MIKTIIFDLDDTLIDTSKLLIPIAHTSEFIERLQRPLPLMAGAEENLKILSKKYQLFLLTQGDYQVQLQKIKSANCAHYFQNVYISDSTLGQNKTQFLLKILSENPIEPETVLSFGNRRSGEIRDAKRLRCQTCLFLHGEHRDEEIVIAEDKPDFEIFHHSEMIPTCRL